MRVAVINGPNLNLLGERQPEIYGTETLGDLEKRIVEWAGTLGTRVTTHQSNSEGEIVDLIHDAGRSHDAVIINPGGYTHSSIAIADAIASISIPTVEVHMSDIRDREEWRSKSLIAHSAIRHIYGRGALSYRDALRYLFNRSAMTYETLSYGPATDQIGDLRPGDERKPLVVLVHGGLWLRSWERDTTESVAVALTESGFSTLNIEYRRLGSGPAWPGSGHDVEMAIRFAGNMSSSLVVMGHSAGGYLGLWAQARRPAAQFVGLAPITYLDSTYPSVSEIAAAGAPETLYAVDDSTLLIHGSTDRVVPIDHSTRLQSRCRVEIVEDLGHFDLLDPAKSHWPLLINALETL